MRRGDVRRRSPPQSPSRSRARNSEYSPPRRMEIGERSTYSRFDRSLGLVTDECQRSRRIDRGSESSARRDYDRHYYDDGDRDRDRGVQSRRLSEFNEGLPPVESTAMKFQWKQLLAEPNKYSKESCDVNPSLDRSIDGYDFNKGDIGRNYEDIRYSDTNLKGYEDTRYSHINLKSYDGNRYSDTNLKSYEDLRNSDTNLKGYEDRRNSDTNLKIYEDLRYSETNVKSYEDIRNLDTSRPGNLFEKSISTGPDRTKSYSFYSPAIGVSKGSGHLDDGFTLPSVNLDSSRVQPHSEKLQVDKSPRMGYYKKEYHKEERNSVVYSKEIGDYNKFPFSGSKTIDKPSLGLLEKDFPSSFKRSSTRSTRPLIGRDGYGQESRSKSPLEVYDKRDYSLSYRSPKDEEYGDYYTHVNGRRSVRDHMDMGTTSKEEFHGTMPTFEEKCSRRDLLRTSNVDPIVDRLENFSHRAQWDEREQWDHSPSSEGQGSQKYLKASGSRMQVDRYCGHEREVYEDQVSLLSGEGDYYERDDDPWTHEDSCRILSMEEFDPYFDEMGDGGSTTILKRKRGVDDKLGSKSSRRIHDEEIAGERQTTYEDRKLLFSSKKSISPKPRHLSEPHSSSQGKDIKNRLGPHSHSLLKNSKSLLKRLGPRTDDSYHSSMKKGKSLLKKRLGPLPNDSNSSLGNGKSLLKKRLGPRHQKKIRVPLPWLNLEGFNQRRMLSRKNQFDDGGRKNQIDDAAKGDSSDGNLIIRKAEPREDSVEFKQMVDHAFFRFVKQLNEDSDQRRRYTEQGGDRSSLKCSVCGSDSKEFLDTESLAVHAFTSLKVGYKSQHLGFHKALCVLMGWKSEVGPKNTWVRENLSGAEALALKEDLIIWPPVLIIHNSSLKSKNPDERVIVSVEVLESLLKEMGYGDRTKVCQGQLANQSIILVKFNATFSGLQEAERLHCFYAESKHGRSELQCFTSELPEAAAPPPAGKVGDLLYGHIGLAEDLDKVDLETKRRCLVKSKREIKNIADTPLKTG